MKILLSEFYVLLLFAILIPIATSAQEYEGRAYYSKKSTLQLGSFGATMSEAQKKQIQERLKNRLEKTFVLTFNEEESLYKEEEKIDAISGATDSWGKNFSPGDLYKNIKTNELVQDQEFYGKQFVVKDSLLQIKWIMSAESKQIGNYMCFKATSSVPTLDLEWYNFSWDQIRNNNSSEESQEEEVGLTDIIAWFTPQIPVSHGPGEFWGLPGLILEVTVGNTFMLSSKIIMNPPEKTKIEAPNKGKELAKMEYKEIITKKMKEMRDNRGRSRGRR
jgi:GLPGLI family protein